MTKALLKNTFRDIKNTKARFISIMAIIALGVGFFAGIKSTSPSMYHLAETYYHTQNLMDFRLLSTAGFTEDDIAAISAVEGVESVMPSYFCDVVTSAEEGSDIVRLIALPHAYGNNEELNSIVLSEGETVKKKGEILTDSSGFATMRHHIGDTIKLAPIAGDSEVADLLSSTEFTVTGKVQSPLYISYQRGTTTIGDGKIDEFMYISAEDFKTERYTELYVKADFSDSVSAFSEEYQTKAEEMKQRLEAAAHEREQSIDIEFINESKEELETAKATLATERISAETQLAEAEETINNSEAEYNEKIAEAQQQLDNAQKQLETNSQIPSQASTDYTVAIAAANTLIAEKEAQLTVAESEYNAAKAAAEGEIAAAQTEIDNGTAQYSVAYETFKSSQEPLLLLAISQSQSTINTLNATIAVTTDADKLAEHKAQLAEEQENLSNLQAQHESAVAQLAAAKAQLDAGQQALDEKAAEGRLQLAAAKEQIDTGKEQLAAAREELQGQMESGQAQLSKVAALLDSAWKELESGKEELEKQKAEGREQLDKAKVEFAAKKTETEQKLKKAQDKINRAEKQLENLSNPQWYIFTRDDTPGYATFSQNADRLDAVASVFPLFFLLVAVLVCVTTMTRLIEEKRTEIATLKALGYGNGAIIAKFIIYSMIAAVTGAVIGTALGVVTLPFIIYNAYKIMYYIGDITLMLHIPSIVLGILAAALTTAAVSVIVCLKSLRVKPAQAMRPKAPKAGKRILMERITPLWKRMGFTAKLTARNLFRYKVRLCMTVIGVAGCTALIVAAFGLLNSFDPLTEVQYGELFQFDAVVVPQQDGSAGEMQYLKQLAADTQTTDAMMLLMQEDVDVSVGSQETNGATSLWVPETPDDFKELIHLRTRIEHAPLTLDDSGVMLNEKLAESLGASVGDKITLTTENAAVQAKISGIYEHYLNNYVFMTPQYYSELFGKEPMYNLLNVRLTESGEQAETAFSNTVLEDSRITAVSFIGQTIKDFKNMLNSLNMVVVVMIVCAAALAFVVLYNLTNINIAERVREIATFKVLGFNNKETSSFIYKENIILTMLGILSGLFLGILLTGFIVKTVEVDNVMFGREIFFSTYLYASALTMLFSLLVNAFMSAKIKAVNMVESLKSVE